VSRGNGYLQRSVTQRGWAVVGCDSWFGGSCQSCRRDGLGREIRGRTRFVVDWSRMSRRCKRTRKECQERVASVPLCARIPLSEPEQCARRIKRVNPAGNAPKRSVSSVCRPHYPQKPRLSRQLGGKENERFQWKQLENHSRGEAFPGRPPLLCHIQGLAPGRDAIGRDAP
jgi:hypothetical protein